MAIVTYPGVALLDLVATKKVLDRLAKASKYRPVSVGQRTEPIASDTPLKIIPEKRFEEVPAPFALVVPGGGVNALKAMGDERLLDYLRFASYGAEVILSVSTGTFLLAAAGILEGQRATTHPSYGGLLQNLGVDYVHGDRVEDGKFLTTAGVSGSIDATLELAARLTDEGIARRVRAVGSGGDPLPDQDAAAAFLRVRVEVHLGFGFRVATIAFRWAGSERKLRGYRNADQLWASCWSRS